MKTKSKMLPMLAAIVANVFWGFSYLMSRIALGVASPDLLLSLRFILATTIMTVIMLVRGQRIRFRGKHIWPLLILCLVEPAGYYFESYGILYTNASISGIALAIVPIFAIAIAAIALKEYPTVRQIIFSAIPIIGVIMITLSGKEIGVATPIGVFFLFMACISYSCYRVVNRVAAREYSAVERTYMVLLSSTIVFTAFALRSVHWDLKAFVAPLAVPQFLIPMLLLSVFCSILSNNFANYASGELTVLEYSVFSSLSTLFSMFGGVLILHEPMTNVMFFGCLMILYGIWQVNKPKEEKPGTEV